MKKSEFKELIKESVKEVLVEENVLKDVITEVVKAVQENSAPSKTLGNVEDFIKEREEADMLREKQRSKLSEAKKKMLNAIGEASYGGVNVFEGTAPLSSGGSPDNPKSPSSPLGGVDPHDSGVDISGLLGNANVWKQIIK